MSHLSLSRYCLCALLFTTACGSGGGTSTARQSGDTATVPPPSEAGDSALVAATPVSPDSVPAPGQDAVTEAELAAAIDTLRRELARLNAAIATTPPSAGAAAAMADSAGEQSPVGDAREVVRATAQGARHLGLRIVWSAIAVALTVLLIRGFVWLLSVLSERSTARRLFYKRLIPIVRLLVWAGAVYYIVAVVFTVDRTGLLAATAALGVGVGFAAQGVLKNMFGGIIIILDQPFQVGDKINIGGTYGEVVSIGLRSTRLVTPDDSLVSVPNGQVVEGHVSNANAGALDCQVVINLYVPGWVDVTKAKGIAYAAAANSKYVYLQKPIVVNVKDVFKETFLTQLTIKAYVLDARHEFAFASDVTEAAKAELLRQGLLPPMHWGPVTQRPWDSLEEVG